MLEGEYNDRVVRHEHLIKIEHQRRGASPTRYQINSRPPNYNYSTLQAKDSPANGCPQRWREEAAQQAAQQAAQSQIGAATSTPDGWYLQMMAPIGG